ncbi:MAG: TetR/AcrR family transcriptional regulator [Myxococcota bacterium]
MPRVLSEQDIRDFRSDAIAQATRLIAENGYAGVTMRSLASEMGCSTMTPYRYFENKEDIFRQACVAAFERLGRRCEAVAEQYDDPVERLRALGREYVRFARAEPHAYRIMFQLEKPVALGEDPDIDAELRRGWQTVLATCEECVKRGRLVGDPLTLAHIAWLGLHGVVTLHLSARLNFQRELDDLLEPMLENFIRGSEARPSSEAEGDES